MMFKTVLKGLDDCRARIENDFQVDLSTNGTDGYLLLRGENRCYDQTETSLKRSLTSHDGFMRPFNETAPFIDFEDIYTDFLVEDRGLDDGHAKGFLQHYGVPTNLFDLTPSFEVARFFATYGGEESPIGVIGAFVRHELAEHLLITDLSGHPFAARPRRQLAFTAAPPPGITDLKSPSLDPLFTVRWYVFTKTVDDLATARRNATYLYPDEAEIEYFFGRDLDHFIQGHWAFGDADTNAIAAIQRQVELTRRALRAPDRR
ncbi:FRG domain-containing protein [Paraburkholderia youngii]|uniref:FRG domain-containing protein n=1 Tax=Paraburkholderia youngii TaxID=2782701 RepID=UPI003D23F3F4